MKKIIAWVFLIFCFAVGANSVFACSCLPVGTVGEELKEAGAVFSAKLIAKEYRKSANDALNAFSGLTDEQRAGAEVLVYKFQVENWWKGNSAKEVVLFTDTVKLANGETGVSSCDFPFEIGKSYLVYAFKVENDLSTNYCTRTKLLEKAGDDLKLLGKGWKPKKR